MKNENENKKKTIYIYEFLFKNLVFKFFIKNKISFLNMTSVPLISVFNVDDSLKVTDKHIPLPAVFSAPIRPDIVHFVHSNIAKNRR